MAIFAATTAFVVGDGVAVAVVAASSVSTKVPQSGKLSVVFSCCCSSSSCCCLCCCCYSCCCFRCSCCCCRCCLLLLWFVLLLSLLLLPSSLGVFALKTPTSTRKQIQVEPFMPPKSTLKNLSTHKRSIMGVFHARLKLQRKAYTKRLWSRRQIGLEAANRVLAKLGNRNEKKGHLQQQTTANNG